MTDPPIPLIEFAERVVALVRSDAELSAALDAYADGGRDNVQAQWLSRIGGYAVTLRFATPTRAGAT